MFAIKLHSNFLKRVKIMKTVDFCITLYKKGTQVDKSTAGHKWVDITPLNSKKLKKNLMFCFVFKASNKNLPNF